MKERFAKVIKWLGALFGKMWRAIPFGKLKGKGSWKWVFSALAVLLILFLILAIYMGRSPAAFDVRQAAMNKIGSGNGALPPGSVTTATLIALTESMLYKPGGYLSNDIMPPTVFMDDIPNWEFGVVVQIRDLAFALRNDLSRSRSQSIEDEDLTKAQPLFNYDSERWIILSTESKYQDGIAATKRYLDRLVDPQQQDAQFFARADNLSEWLAVVGKRLGSLSQRLSASVGQVRTNTDLGGDDAARQSTRTADVLVAKTPWLQIDDVFFEARGYTWSLIHLLQAVEIDFEGVLEKKNAKVMVRQIIRELEGTQQPVRSPMILNGSGFGMFPNHSLVMASYLSRANAAIMDLRTLLSQG